MLQWTREALEKFECMAAEGKPSPLDRQPELLDDLESVWNGWNDLHAARPATGFGVCPIPVADIVAWLDLQELAGEERAETYRLIRAMDDEWLTWAREKLATKKPRKDGTDADATGSHRRTRS